MPVFDRVEKIAKKRKISLKTLALKSGLSENAIYGWKKKTPRSNSLDAVAKVLNVSVDDLLGNKKDDSIPDWATEKDINDLHEFLMENGNMNFRGVELSEEQRKRVDDIITQVFWEELKKEHKINE